MAHKLKRELTATRRAFTEALVLVMSQLLDGQTFRANAYCMFNKYGLAAIAAAKDRASANPIEAWQNAMLTTFPNSESSRKKGCPKGAFLGLCEEGLVQGVPPGRYTTSVDNKAYAIRGYAILQSARTPMSPRTLWQRIMSDRRKAHNSQADVVLALWQEGLLIR